MIHNDISSSQRPTPEFNQVRLRSLLQNPLFRDPEPSRLIDGTIMDIRFADNEALRMRTVVRRSNCRPTGQYPSVRMQRMLQWESRHELNAMRLLDCDSNVSTFHEQPCEIIYSMNGQMLRHYPDFYVKVDGKKELWEIKVAEDLPRFSARTTLMQSQLPRFGYSYRIVTAEELAEQPRLDNCRCLLGFGRGAINPMEREVVRRYLKEHGSFTWNQILANLFGDHGRTIVCRLAIEGLLTFDMSGELGPSTRFFMHERKM